MPQPPLAPPPQVSDKELWRWLFLLWKRFTASGLVSWESISFEGSVITTAVSMSMDDSYQTYVVTATGQTLTLPAASAERVGKVWTAVFGASGTMTIQRAGTNTITTPDSLTDTSVIVTVQGTSLDFRCESATTWVIV